jgi:hypothetical protein
MSEHFSRNGFLTAKGLAWIESERASELYVDEVLDGQGRRLYLDSSGSVSATDEDEDSYVLDDGMIDEQFRRNFHGSSF